MRGPVLHDEVTGRERHFVDVTIFAGESEMDLAIEHDDEVDAVGRCIPLPSFPGVIPDVAPMLRFAARSSSDGTPGVSGTSVKRSRRIPPSGPKMLFG